MSDGWGQPDGGSRLGIWLVIVAVAIFLAVGVGAGVLAMAQYG